MRSGEKNFEEIKMNYLHDDMIYRFSDDDQYGGEKGKKYSTGRLKEYLMTIHALDISLQKTMLNDEIERWRGN